MKSSEMIEKSVYIITEYYRNNIWPCLDSCDEQCLWYGPAVGQFMQGREAMVKAWENEDNPLTFTMGRIESRAISSSSCFCEVMLSFPVITHYPNGDSIPVHQRMHLTWCERKIRDDDEKIKKIPKLLMVHISNPYHNHDADVIYPVRYNSIYKQEALSILKGQRIVFHGTDKSVHFIMSDDILWIETISSTRKSLVHTGNKVIKVTESLSKIENDYPDIFLRVHIGYLVNPYYVCNIRRFKLTMTDGTEIPVPEKKYTRIKKIVTELG